MQTLAAASRSPKRLRVSDGRTVAVGTASLKPEAPVARYELVRMLREGASGAVYLAVDSETRQQVALKKLLRVDQKSVQRFKHEFRALADLHHPNLVKLFDLQRGE